MRHGVDDAVGLGGRGHVLSGAMAGEFESETGDPVHSDAREHGFLNDNLPFRSLVETAAGLGILALRVFPDDDEVDVFGRASGQRGGDSRQQPYRPHVHVLVEVAPDGDEKPPERHVIRHFGQADGPKENGVERSQPLDTVLRHHDAVLGKIPAGVGKFGEFHLEREALRKFFEDPHAFGHDFPSDAVPRDQCDTVSHDVALLWQ